MTEEYSREEIDWMVDNILGAGEEKPLRQVVCRRCGTAFETFRPAVKLCRACRNAAKAENARKGRAVLAERSAGDEERIATASVRTGDAMTEGTGCTEDGAAEQSPPDSAKAPLTLEGKAKATVTEENQIKGKPGAAAAGTVLTLGVLRRLLDNVDGSAVICADGGPVKAFCVEHLYDLETGEESYRVHFGF